ncbi:IclR family transcriptional regulator [Psychrobacter glacincola]|uniref:IclR family transcriptional regulator n=1 Tax=Psychrobacter glacincola TaxID=56810 RepID=UPI0039B104D4
MIASVTASLDLLKLITARPNLGLSELARLSNTNKSRTYRMVTTLCQAGYVCQNPDHTYRLGHQALIIGQAARQQIDIFKIAEPVIENLAESFDESIQIRVREGMEMMQIYSRRSQQSVQVHSDIGNCRPLGKGASGKILLAYASEEEVQLGTQEQQKLYDELLSLRETQVAHSYSELSSDVSAIAVPLFDYEQNCIASLSVSIPMSRLSPEYESQLTIALKEAGKRISTAFGAAII